jgi:hypothetical protein
MELSAVSPAAWASVGFLWVSPADMYKKNQLKLSISPLKNVLFLSVDVKIEDW